jgi:hypothetical protein
MITPNPRLIPALRNLQHVVAAFSRPDKSPNRVEPLLDFITTSLGADLAEVWIAVTGKRLELLSSRGTEPEHRETYKHLTFDSNPYIAYRDDRLLVVDDPNNDIKLALNNYSRGVFAESCAYLPITAAGATEGVIGVASLTRGFFTPEVTSVLQLLAICLAQALQAEKAPESVSPDGLDIDELPDAGQAELPSVSRPFYAAKRHPRVGMNNPVDNDGADLKRAGNT